MSNQYLHAVRDFELERVLVDFPSQDPAGKRMRVLDIGAGTGRQASRLRDIGYDVVAIDLPVSAYAQRRVYPVVDYDGRVIPLSSGTVDIVFSSNVLEHVEDVHGLLREMDRVLARDGVMLHVLPTPAWRWWTLATHYPWVLKKVLQKAFRRKGEVSQTTDHPKGSSNALWSLLWPARHGSRGSTLTEMWLYSESSWRRTFESAGFKIVETYPIGLFYTGSMLWGAESPFPFANTWLVGWGRLAAPMCCTPSRAVTRTTAGARYQEQMMNKGFPRVAAPGTGEPLSWESDGCIAPDGTRYPIVEGIPRFVPSDNYANAFGDQWLRFPKTQLDSITGIPLSAQRLRRCLRTELESLDGKLVLEAGSGAGRFTEILLAHGAEVDSFDYSRAVDANAFNNGANPRLSLVQADIRRMPFPDASYDLVLCLGVVQHTPNSEESIRALWAKVRPGGRLVFDHYRWKVRNFLPPPLGVAGMVYRWYFLRRPRAGQFQDVKRVVDRWFPLVWRFRDSRLAQFVLSRLNPIVNYYPHFGLRDREMYYEWALLDTHDAMTDVYKHRRTRAQLERFLQALGAVDIDVRNGGNGVEASCRKPA